MNYRVECPGCRKKLCVDLLGECYRCRSCFACFTAEAGEEIEGRTTEDRLESIVNSLVLRLEAQGETMNRRKGGESC